MRNPFGHDDAPADSDSDLIGIIRQVRRRWRMKLALRGAAIVAALTVVVFLAAALGLESSRFAPDLFMPDSETKAEEPAALMFRTASGTSLKTRGEEIRLVAVDADPAASAQSASPTGKIRRITRMVFSLR